MREAGIDNVEAQIWLGLFAPAGTPPDVINRLHAAALRVLATDKVKAEFDRDGLTIVTDASPAAFRDVVAADIVKWAAVVKAAGISPE
jgi:tripartite-type tricarboxylate transporter receptor subunit TctC